MEHRWGKRVAVDIPIRLGAPLFVAKRGRLMNVSLSGAFIQTTVDVRVLSRVDVMVEIPGRPKREAVPVSAYVARKSEVGIGVEWFEFAPSIVTQLIRSAAAKRQRALRREEKIAAARL
jgi:hypothetical protein